MYIHVSNHADTNQRAYIMKNEINAVPTRLTVNGRKAITSATASQIKANGRTSATVDQLMADGMLWTDFIAPSGEGSTSTPELHKALKAAIVEGFSAGDRKLLATPTKALNDDNSAAKRLKQQSVGAFMGSFKRDLKARQEPAAPKTRAAQQPTGEAGEASESGKDVNIKLLELIVSATKKAQGMDDPSFNVNEFVRLMKAAALILAAK
tara:strand:- start:151 stop:777 length:627 start_codon:yes stop_codon:yes gene_type:complete